MHNVWLIARREYLERIRTRGFLITTIMIPLDHGRIRLRQRLLGGADKVRRAHRRRVHRHAAPLDLQAELARAAEAAAPRAPNSSPAPPQFIVDAIDPGPDTRASLDDDLDCGDLDGYLWITPPHRPARRPALHLHPRAPSAGSAPHYACLRAVYRPHARAAHPSRHRCRGRRHDAAARRDAASHTGQATRSRLRSPVTIRALLPDVHGHHALRHERRALHHRREDLAHLRGDARHHPPRRDDGRQDPRRRLGRPHPGRHLAHRALLFGSAFAAQGGGDASTSASPPRRPSSSSSTSSSAISFTRPSPRRWAR